MSDTVRYVMFYESGDLSLAAENFPAHQARYTEFIVMTYDYNLLDRAGA